MEGYAIATRDCDRVLGPPNPSCSVHVYQEVRFQSDRGQQMEDATCMLQLEPLGYVGLTTNAQHIGLSGANVLNDI